MTSFPTSIKTFTSKTDGVDTYSAAHINDLQNEVAAIETELGTDPAGSYSTVKDRLNAVLEEIVSDTTPVLGGDLDADGKNITSIGKIVLESATIEISSGAITVSKSLVFVDAEGSAADDLVTINGGTEGMILYLMMAGANAVTVKDGTGNINLGASGDFAMNYTDNLVLKLIYRGTTWQEISRS